MSDLGDRSTYLGCSDLGPMLGLSTYMTPLDLYLQKIGEAPPTEQTTAMRMGQILEDAVVVAYEEQSGYRTQRRAAPYVHPHYSWFLGHVDRIIVNEPGLMDSKASAYAHGYGEPGTDAVPPSVRVQMQGYMGLSSRLWADVALLRGTRGLDIYRVHHDGGLWDALVTAAVDFWTENVGRRVPPPVDGTESYRRYLSGRFPKDGGLELVATSEQALLVADLRNTVAAIKQAEKHEALLKNQLMAAMGEATALVAPDGRITWKTQGPRVAWQDVAVDVARDAGLDVAQYAAAQLEGKAGPRVFLFKPVERAEEATAA